MSKVYKYQNSTFSNYVIDALDSCGGYYFIRNAVFNLKNIGFEYLRAFIDFPSLEIYSPVPSQNAIQ